MRFTFLSVLIVLASVQVLRADNVSHCSGLSELAGSLMDLRQAGGLLSEYLQGLQEAGYPQEVVDLVTSIALDAWEWPRFATEDYKKSAVSDFSNDIFGICMNVRLTSD